MLVILKTLLLRDERVNQPTNIVGIDAETDGLFGFDEIGGPTAVDTFTIGSSTYAIVVSQQDDSVTIIDVSNPSNIVEVDTEPDGLNGFEELDRPFGVDTFTIGANTYAIVTAFRDDGVQIIDVSNPENIVAKDYLTDTDGALLELDGAKGVDTFTIGANTYAIVTAVADNGVQIIDVTNPESIIALSNLEDFDEHDRLNGAFDVEIFTIGASTYAIVASNADNAVQMIDVSDPEDIRALQFIPDDNFLLLQKPKGVDTFTVDSSTYAIVASFGDNGVQMIDISDPENISATISLPDTES